MALLPSRKWLASFATGIALIALAVIARQYLEQTMTRHMLVQIPLLIGGGVFLGRALLQSGQNADRPFAAWNENGLPGLSAFLLVTAYWMVPKALDDAIASASMEQAKLFSLVVAGIVLPVSLARANIIIQLFFLGNFAAMSAFVGLIYQDAPSRLCNAYLQDDQQSAGVGLVVIAVVLPLLWYLLYKQNRSGGTRKLSSDW